ncbi:MAG TPA: ABC transporter permease [Puia sp.]|jgi:ABC-type antimicrobial peptide transport system permease subunit|nr:ABC transporter permease [Puia sp.]
MLKSYFIIAWRNFKRNRLITLINVFGLSVGVMAAVIIYLMIHYNFSFDTYEPDRDRIYRVVTENVGSTNFGVPAPLHEALLPAVAGIGQMAPLFDYGGGAKVSILKGNGQPGRVIRNQDNIVFADSGYFQLFPHQWIEGDPLRALGGPNQVVLTKSTAELYFPGLASREILGRTIVFSDSVYANVSGIVKDLDFNSDFEYKVFLSLSTISFSNLSENYHWDSWGATSSGCQLMVKTLPGVRPENINRQLATLFAAHVSDKADARARHRLQELGDIHTNTDFSGKISKEAIGSLVLLAVFLLLLGCINYINLSTAQGAQRAKEIGIRKTFGGNRKQLVLQFLMEAFLLAAITGLISFALVTLLLPSFSPAGVAAEHILDLPSLVLFLICLVCVVSLLSGVYPAFILSRLQPLRVLKNQPFSDSSVSQGAWLRRASIIFQFTIAQVFIVGVFVVNKQVHYELKKDMGFRKEAIVYFGTPSSYADAARRKTLLRDELKNIPGIENISIGNQSPAFSGQIANTVWFSRGKKEMEVKTDVRSGDTVYLSVYHIPLVAGRNISGSDSVKELLINETLTRQLGFKRPVDALGHFLKLNDQSLPVVGVMADFNQASVRNSIRPLVFYSDFLSDNLIQISLRPDADTWRSTLAEIESSWKSIYPEEEFHYTFLDEAISRFYRQDAMLSSLLTFAAGIAISISSIGLLGLVIFTLNSRTREIGIRKVLGASLVHIMGLLSKGFMRPLILAFAIAVPIAWFLCHAYLQNFAYHTGLSWWVFGLSGVTMMAIAVATVGLKVLKAARANPVGALKND